jgi:NADH dehydrogenase FAD-containing subunit
MKNIQEALNIRSYVLQNLEEAVRIENPADRKANLNFVIVGGGPTGVELSGAIAEIKNNVLEKDYPELKNLRCRFTWLKDFQKYWLTYLKNLLKIQKSTSKIWV